MISREDLQNNNLLADLTGEMIDKLLPAVQLLKFAEQDSVFKENDVADSVYMVKSGKVLLEQKISSNMTVTVDNIKAGKTFGWASILSEGVHSLDAVCAEPCEVISINADAFMDILKGDHSMGFLVLQRVSEVIKLRLDRRTQQFVSALVTHPDIHELEEE